jgi:hypothetical protein
MPRAKARGDLLNRGSGEFFWNFSSPFLSKGDKRQELEKED